MTSRRGRSWTVCPELSNIRLFPCAAGAVDGTDGFHHVYFGSELGAGERRWSRWSELRAANDCEGNNGPPVRQKGRTNHASKRLMRTPLARQRSRCVNNRTGGSIGSSPLKDGRSNELTPGDSL